MKLRFSITLVLITLSLNAQVHKFKALQYIGKKQNQEWSKPEELYPPVLIVLDLDNSKYKIYNAKTNTLDIIDEDKKIVDEKGNTIFTFMCVSDDGDELIASHKFQKDSKYSILTLYFKDFIIAYNLIDN